MTLPDSSSTSSPAAAIVAALRPHLPLALGSLCVWGDWFGKPRDNLHIAVGAGVESTELVIEFHHRDVLGVREPGDWRVDPAADAPEPRLVIRTANRVAWGWYSYGRPEVPENWFEEHHWREGRSVRASTTDTWYQPSFAPSLDEPAVIFL